MTISRIWRPFGLRPHRSDTSGCRPTRCSSTEFIDAHNAEGKPFVWTKTADEILANIARFA